MANILSLNSRINKRYNQLFKSKRIWFNSLIRREKAPWYVLILIALLYGLGIFSRGMHNMDYFIIWTRDFVHGNLLAEYHIDRVTTLGEPEDLTVPYTPFSLYLIGGVAKFLLLFLPDRDSTYVLSVNITSVAANFGIYYLLKRKYYSIGNLAPWVYLITPAVFIATPLLGYQDSIMTVFILLAIYFAQKENFLLSGVFGALAVMSKQLAAMPIFGLCVVILLQRNWKNVIRWAVGASFIASAVLSPFIISGNLANYLRAQSQASIHTMLSAQGANLPWLASYIFRIVTLPISEAVSKGGDVLDLNNLLIRRLTYLSLGITCVAIFLVWAVRNSRKLNFDPYSYTQASIIMYLSYYLIAAGVHENHIYPVLALLFSLNRFAEPRAAYKLCATALAIHLVNYYGLGRDISWIPSVRIQAPIISGILVMISLTSFALALKKIVVLTYSENQSKLNLN